MFDAGAFSRLSMLLLICVAGVCCLVMVGGVFTEHQNFFGVDDSLGPVAVSIKREKIIDDKDGNSKSDSNYFQYRIIIRTQEVTGF